MSRTIASYDQLTAAAPRKQVTKEIAMIQVVASGYAGECHTLTLDICAGADAWSEARRLLSMGWQSVTLKRITRKMSYSIPA